MLGRPWRGGDRRSASARAIAAAKAQIEEETRWAACVRHREAPAEAGRCGFPHGDLLATLQRPRLDARAAVAEGRQAGDPPGFERLRRPGTGRLAATSAGPHAADPDPPRRRAARHASRPIRQKRQGEVGARTGLDQRTRRDRGPRGGEPQGRRGGGEAVLDQAGQEDRRAVAGGDRQVGPHVPCHEATDDRARQPGHHHPLLGRHSHRQDRLPVGKGLNTPAS